MVALADLLPDLLPLLTGPLMPPPAARPLPTFLRTLRITEGDYQGSFDPAWHPGQRALIELIQAGFPVILYLKPAQDGGSTTIAGFIIHQLIDLRRTCVYATTDKILMRKLYSAKVKPMMQASNLGRLLPQDGAGSGTGFTDDLLMGTGTRLYLLGAGASNGAGQAGVTAQTVVVDEVDKLRQQQRRQLHSRVRSAADPLRIEVGTIDNDGDDGADREWEATTGGRIHYPCPCCGTWVPFLRERLRWDEADPDRTARYHCPACDEGWNEAQRQAALPHGRQVHAGQRRDGPDGTITGPALNPSKQVALKIVGLDSPLRAMGRIAAEYADALRKKRDLGDSAHLRQVLHDEFTERLIDVEHTLKLRETDLAARSAVAGLTRGELPPDAQLVTVGQDVQLRAHYWVSLAYCPADGRWWILDYGRKAVCGDGDEPTQPERETVLDHIATRGAEGWSAPDGRHISALATGVDTGDGNTRPQVLPWLFSRGEPFYAIKGLGGRPGADLAGGHATERLPGVLAVYRQPSYAGQPEWDQISVAVDELKAEVLRALTRKPGAPGAGHLPVGEATDGFLIRALCAERLDSSEGQPRWVLVHRYNHYLDCVVYALALAKWKSAWLTSGGDQTPVFTGGFA